jgi:hypothetical protein
MFKNRRDHKRLNVAQKRHKHLYKELLLNKYVKGSILGYIEQGKKRRFITEPNIPVKKKKILLKKERNLYEGI